MRAAAILQVENVSKAFNGNEVLRGVSLSISQGERRGLIGPNGAGKTTLFNIISGQIHPSEGSIQFDGVDITSMAIHKRARIGLGRTFQIASLFDSMTVFEHIVLALVAREQLVSRGMGSPLWSRAIREEVGSLLEAAGLSGFADQNINSLAYGFRRMLDITLALACQPKVLLLDEPAAGLSGEETVRLTRLLTAIDRSLTVLIIEHDMDLLFEVVDSVTVLDSGRLLAQGSPQEIRRNPEVRARYLGRSRGLE